MGPSPSDHQLPIEQSARTVGHQVAVGHVGIAKQEGRRTRVEHGLTLPERSPELVDGTAQRRDQLGLERVRVDLVANQVEPERAKDRVHTA